CWCSDIVVSCVFCRPRGAKLVPYATLFRSMDAPFLSAWFCDDSSRLQGCTASPPLLADVVRPGVALADHPAALSGAAPSGAGSGLADVPVHARAAGDRQDQPGTVFPGLECRAPEEGAAGELRLQRYRSVRDGHGLVVAQTAAGAAGPSRRS